MKKMTISCQLRSPDGAKKYEICFKRQATSKSFQTPVQYLLLLRVGG